MSSQPSGGNSDDQTYDSQAILNRYEPVIGLEVHCQLNTVSKLFCSCPTTFGQEPNQNTCPVCLGHPGVLPVLNEKVVDAAVMFALAVEAKINPRSVFSRKQYFYPDLPKGYQISQFDLPYCEGGGITLDDSKYIILTRAHIEEDAGKNIHADQASYIDLNRAGIPLIEIVTEPVIHTAEHAAEYLRKLRTLVRYIGISDGNLEEGSFRCDANVSIRKRGSDQLNTRCEVKNLNSFKNVERAIQYEIVRQADLMDHQQEVMQETRLFDPALNKTKAMRDKADAQDYRYFPDPDLGCLEIVSERIETIRAGLPELPQAKASRFKKDFDLSQYDAQQLTAERELAEYFEQTLQGVKGCVSAKIVANWVLGEFLREFHLHNWTYAQLPVSPKNLADLLKLLGDGTISGKIAKIVFEFMVSEGKSPELIVKEKGLVQVSDRDEIAAVVSRVIQDNVSQVEEYVSGKEKVFGFFVGQVMKLSRGKFNPAVVNEILKEKLDECR